MARLWPESGNELSSPVHRPSGQRTGLDSDPHIAHDAGDVCPPDQCEYCRAAPGTAHNPNCPRVFDSSPGTPEDSTSDRVTPVYPLRQQLQWYDCYSDRACDVIVNLLGDPDERLRLIALGRDGGINGYVEYGDRLCHNPDPMAEAREEIRDCIWYVAEYLRRQ